MAIWSLDLAGFEAIILFVIGIGLNRLEFFLPGGILGILALRAIIGSLFMARIM